MLKSLCGFLVTSVALVCVAPALADPSVNDIYNAADAGHLSEAEQMVEQVLQSHPHSARAHWMAAEIYARANNLDRARQELTTAQQLAPGLPFVRPEAVVQLQQQLGESVAAPQPQSQQEQTQQEQSQQEQSQQEQAHHPPPQSQRQSGFRAGGRHLHMHSALRLRMMLFIVAAIIVLVIILWPRSRTPRSGSTDDWTR
jgi:hypothetical protein